MSAGPVDSVAAAADNGSAARGLDSETIVDAATGKRYQLLVSRPAGPAPAHGYPAIYLFDGNRTAPLARDWLADHGLADRVLVVGLGYPDTRDFNVPRRYQDLTPTAVADHPGSGQSQAFFAFVQTQVRPRVAERYAVNARRTLLYGHSLGGLTVLDWLQRHPAAYTRYAAASPSLWWDDGVVKDRLERFVRDGACTTAAAPHDVLVTVGRLEQPLDAAGEPDPQRRAKLARRRMVDNARWAANLLSACDTLDVRFRVFADTGHGEALVRGLDLALSRWLLEEPAGSDEDGQ